MYRYRNHHGTDSVLCDEYKASVCNSLTQSWINRIRTCWKKTTFIFDRSDITVTLKIGQGDLENNVNKLVWKNEKVWHVHELLLSTKQKVLTDEKLAMKTVLSHSLALAQVAFICMPALNQYIIYIYNIIYIRTYAAVNQILILQVYNKHITCLQHTRHMYTP